MRGTSQIAKKADAEARRGAKIRDLEIIRAFVERVEKRGSRFNSTASHRAYWLEAMQDELAAMEKESNE